MLTAIAIGGTGETMAQERSGPAASPLTCTVEAGGGGSRVTLSGRIAGDPASGRYRLEVRKIGAAGRSTIAQAGEFHAQGGGPVSVGHVDLGLERDARYEAVLTVVAAGRTYTCETFGPGPRPL